MFCVTIRNPQKHLWIITEHKLTRIVYNDDLIGLYCPSLPQIGGVSSLDPWWMKRGCTRIHKNREKGKKTRLCHGYDGGCARPYFWTSSTSCHPSPVRLEDHMAHEKRWVREKSDSNRQHDVRKAFVSNTEAYQALTGLLLGHVFYKVSPCVRCQPNHFAHLWNCMANFLYYGI